MLRWQKENDKKVTANVKKWTFRDLSFRNIIRGICGLWPHCFTTPCFNTLFRSFVHHSSGMVSFLRWIDQYERSIHCRYIIQQSHHPTIWLTGLLIFFCRYETNKKKPCSWAGHKTHSDSHRKIIILPQRLSTSSFIDRVTRSLLRRDAKYRLIEALGGEAKISIRQRWKRTNCCH